ncbi:DUF6965 family protein [Spirosoma flavum]|uniref:DUF6965 family protein n=1 Tax=Spirosoma flavum TaxID=2048557 RepID=A0ABW6ASC6_9BACT
MQKEVEALVKWFEGKKLPEGYFAFSAWESTYNLANTVSLAFDNARAGNTNSLAVLKRVKEKLESGV